jgi:hydroxyacylglutathione hydrolase
MDLMLTKNLLKPDKLIQDKEVLKFGNIELEVIFGPGHAPGHVAFYNKENNILIAGDILFKGSFGRVDLPGGSMEILKQTIYNRMFTLPENTLVYPGHGDYTSIGEEKRTNYILQF